MPAMGIWQPCTLQVPRMPLLSRTGGSMHMGMFSALQSFSSQQSLWMSKSMVREALV